MRLWIVLIYIFINSVSHAQTGVKINYKQVGSPLRHSAVFTDSASFKYHYVKNDTLKDRMDYGKQIIHHAAFLNYATGIKYEYSRLRREIPFLISQKIAVDHWMLEEGEKVICGYNCKKAVGYTEGQPAVTAWYTLELGESLSHPGYTGYPGITMETYNEEYGWRAVAISVSKGNFTLQLPDVKIITSEEFRKQNR